MTLTRRGYLSYSRAAAANGPFKVSFQPPNVKCDKMEVLGSCCIITWWQQLYIYVQPWLGITKYDKGTSHSRPPLISMMLWDLGNVLIASEQLPTQLGAFERVLVCISSDWTLIWLFLGSFLFLDGNGPHLTVVLPPMGTFTAAHQEEVVSPLGICTGQPFGCHCCAAVKPTICCYSWTLATLLKIAPQPCTVSCGAQTGFYTQDIYLVIDLWSYIFTLSYIETKLPADYCKDKCSKIPSFPFLILLQVLSLPFWETWAFEPVTVDIILWTVHR